MNLAENLRAAIKIFRYINGKKLEEGQKIKIHADKGTYTVTIKDITCDYSGLVVCEAVNEYGKASSQATLKVLPRGEPPDFLEWLANIRAREGKLEETLDSITMKYLTILKFKDQQSNTAWFIPENHDQQSPGL